MTRRDKITIVLASILLALYAVSAWQRHIIAQPSDPATVELMRKAAEEHEAKSK